MTVDINDVYHNKVDAEFKAVFCVSNSAGVCDLFQAMRKLGQICQMLRDVFQDLEMKKTSLLELRRVTGVLGIISVNCLVQLVPVMPVITCSY